MHLDGPAVGRLASRTGAGRVLLTHLQMGFDADATLAAVGAAYDGATAFVVARGPDRPSDGLNARRSRPARNDRSRRLRDGSGLAGHCRGQRRGR